MKIKIKKYAGSGFWLAVMILVYGLALAASKAYPTEEAALMLYKKGDFLNGRQADELKVQNDQLKQPLHFTLWGEKKNQEIFVPDYGRVEKADVLIINGSSKLLLPQAPVLDKDDRQGCLLSEDLAYKLFGSKEVIGLTAHYQNQDYQVKGIIRKAKQTMVIQSNQQTEAVLSKAALDVPGGEARKTAAAEFEQLMGAADTKRLDFNAVVRVGQLVTALLPLLMIGVVAYMAVKQAVYLRETPFKFIVFIIGAGIFILVFIYLADWGEGLYFPFSPSRWSDFQYWERTAKELQEGFRDFLTIEKQAPESMVIGSVFSAGWNLLLGMIIFCWKIRKLVPERGMEVLLYCLISIFGAFLAVLLAEGSGQIASNPGLWLFPSFYIIGKYGLEKLTPRTGGPVKRNTPDAV